MNGTYKGLIWLRNKLKLDDDLTYVRILMDEYRNLTFSFSNKSFTSESIKSARSAERKSSVIFSGKVFDLVELR